MDCASLWLKGQTIRNANCGKKSETSRLIAIGDSNACRLG
jgi:hypothetical protein